MKKEIILIGGGGHCKACIDVIEQDDNYTIVGIIDKKEKVNQYVLDYKIIGTDNDLEVLSKKYKYFFISLGQTISADLRKKMFIKLLSLNVELPSIISPFAYVSKYANIGKGCIIMHRAIVNANANIGDNCIINNMSLIEHDAIIGDHCHVSTASVINGGVKLGNESFYGSGAISRQYIEIPKKSFIKANSIVKY